MIIRIECKHGAVENLMHGKESKFLSVHRAFFKEQCLYEGMSSST